MRLVERRRWPDALYASIEPDGPAIALQADLAAAFPSLPIYGGAIDVFVPHVTIAEGRAVDDPAVEADPAWDDLPVTRTVTEVELIVRDDGRPLGLDADVPAAGARAARLANGPSRLPPEAAGRHLPERAVPVARPAAPEPACPGTPAVHRGTDMRLDRRPAASRSPAPVAGRGGGNVSPAARTSADAVDVALLDGGADPDSGAAQAISAAGVLDLQRVAGNAAVTGVLSRRRPTVQRWGLGGFGAFIPAHPELREGMTGEAVRELQEKLSLASAAGGPLTVDGDFGPATRVRLRAFRAARGLGNSPVADAALWTALDAAVAALPAPVRPVLSVGSTGPDVALAQQKLNAIAGAGAPFAIDGIFSLPMAAIVLAFKAGRGLTANGTIDAATWQELDRAVAGGGVRQEGGTAVEQHVLNSAGASPLGAPIAGTTLHRPVGPGGLLRGPAVREFQLKLNVWRNSQALAPITDDGKWGNDTRTATVAFQAATPGLGPGSGIGDQPTWTALDAIAGTVAVGSASGSGRRRSAATSTR